MSEEIKRGGNDQHWRTVLFRKDPHCYWCDVEVVQPSDCAYINQPNMATLDHVLPRYKCESKKQYRAYFNRVLACLQCNAKRNHSDQWAWAGKQLPPPRFMVRVIGEKTVAQRRAEFEFPRPGCNPPIPPELSEAFSSIT